MAQMRITHIALHLDTRHSERGVFDILDHILLDWLRKARPARTRVELDTGIEKLGITAYTLIFPRVITAAKLTAKSRLRPFLPGDAKLLRRQLRLPFGIGLLDPMVRRGIAFVGKIQDIVPVDHTGCFGKVRRNPANRSYFVRTGTALSKRVAV